MVLYKQISVRSSIKIILNANMITSRFMLYTAIQLFVIQVSKYYYVYRKFNVRRYIIIN